MTLRNFGYTLLDSGGGSSSKSSSKRPSSSSNSSSERPAKKKKHRKVEVPKYQCPNCHCAFQSKSELKKHLKDIHGMRNK